jgi:hypothetical protein
MSLRFQAILAGLALVLMVGCEEPANPPQDDVEPADTSRDTSGIPDVPRDFLFPTDLDQETYSDLSRDPLGPSDPGPEDESFLDGEGDIEKRDPGGDDPGAEDPGFKDATDIPGDGGVDATLLCRTPEDCSDGDPCTLDLCDPATGCSNPPHGGPCDDGNGCTVNDACVDGVCIGDLTPVCGCVRDSDCDVFDDGNLCNGVLACLGGRCVVAQETIVSCEVPDDAPCLRAECEPATGNCLLLPVPDGRPCSDGDFCTSGDSCLEGVCVGEAYTCNDGLACTDDACDGLGGCGFMLRPDWCVIDGACAAGNQTSQGNPCRICLPYLDTNAWSNNDLGSCSDGLTCTDNDRCIDMACVGSLVVCDNENPCTDAACVEGEGCVFTANTVPCDDDDPCSWQDMCSDSTCQGIPYSCEPGECHIAATCDGLGGCETMAVEDGTGCAADDDQCTWDRCVAGECVHTPEEDGTICDDGNACTTNDECTDGECAGTPVVCTAMDQCHTAGVCNQETGICSNPTRDDDSPCDDDDLCTQVDSCLSGVCVGYDPVVCTVTDPCQAGSCEPSTGLCEGQDKDDGTPCSDGSACTLDDECVFGTCTGTPVVCTALDQCHDVGICNVLTGICSTPEKPDETPCDDGIPCTSGDMCTDGTCSGTPVTCDDDDVCNGLETCDTQTGECLPGTPLTCDDGDVCNGTETCDPTDGCVAGTPPTCDDGDYCNGVETCDPLDGCVAGTPPTCDDGDVCNGTETCDPTDGCVAGTPLTCTSDNPCMDATCDAGEGCVYAPNTNTCNDGDPCTWQDTCDEGTCRGIDYSCEPGECHIAATCDGLGGCEYLAMIDGTECTDDGNDCSWDRCVDGECLHTAQEDGTQCDDRNACTTNDECTDGECAGAPVVCTAMDQCHTAGVCNQETGICSNPTRADDSPCNDNDLCTQVDTCLDGVCVGSDQVVCTVTDPCQAGSCNPETGLCEGEDKPDGMDCNDGNACTLDDECLSGTCTGTPKVCVALNQCHSAGTCNVQTGICTNPTMPDETPCNDGIPCTSGDVCMDGTCSGTPVICDDSDICNGVETCETQTGDCLPGTPLTCDDGNFCNGAETCHPTDGCVAGTPPTCDDDDYCNGDETCHPTDGCVAGTPPTCDDDDVCNGTETCHPTDGCVAGTPPTCDDDDVCNGVETCHPTDGCVAGTPPTCDDDDVCNGTETCHPTDGCVAGTPPTCDDDDVCNGTETCHPTAGCVAGTPLTCTSDNPCIDATCDAAEGCVYAPNTNTCNDGDPCTWQDTCDEGTCRGIDYSCEPGECHIAATCDGLGGCEYLAMIDGTECTDDGNDCSWDRCVDGECLHTAQEDGTQCDDRNACTTNDECTDGQCAGAPVVCTAMDQCHSAGVCDLETGICSNPTRADDSPCNDNDLCTQVDTCLDGVCVGSDQVVCTVTDPCQAGSCNPETGLCEGEDKPDGMDCNDGNACTLDDECVSGTCTGTPKVCVALSQCHSAGTCNVQTGICTNPTRPDNTGCNDGIPCTSGDVCMDGTCSGTPVICDDSDICNGVETCETQTGDCLPGTPLTCDDDDFCNGTETCDPTDGCVAGTPPTCDDDDYCNGVETCDPTDGCVAGTPPTCDDDDVCNGAETCDPTDGCLPGTPLTCTSDNPCMDATCDAVEGCIYAPNTAPCDDGDPCTFQDTCDQGTCQGTPYSCEPGDCELSSNCNGAGGCQGVPVIDGTGCPDEGNPCTWDRCVGGICYHTPDEDGTRCDDGNPCTTGGECLDGECVGTPVVCTSLDQCHDVGTCDTETGICSNPQKQDGSTCDDGSACSQTDSCQDGDCVGSNPVVCPDPAPCHRAGTCNPEDGECDYEPEANGTDCDDSNLCTHPDSCTDGECRGSPYICDDELECTQDACDGLGGCTFTLLGGWCLIDGACAGGSQIDFTNPCGICLPGVDPYTWSNHDMGTCSDDLMCTDSDHCVDLACTGTEVICDDLNPCTDGSCVEGTGCIQTPNSAPCNDDDPCTFQDTCAGETCQGTPYTCEPGDCQQTSTCNGTGGCTTTATPNGIDCTDDGNPCTWDKCVGGTCLHRALIDGTECNDGNLCTRFDECFEGNCTGYNPVVCTVTNPCQAGSCNPETGLCDDEDRPDGTLCTDGNPCTLDDECVSGECTGTARICEPLDQCHVAGTCNTQTGVCTNPKRQDGATCDDNSVCTEADSCQDGTCLGSPIVCNDENPCTDGSCVEGTGCVHTPNSATCDDGNPCTTGDVCGGGACSGEGYTCDDELECTDNVCNGLGGCTFPLKSDWCFIGGACVAGGEVDPLNPCGICTPGSNPLGWSNHDLGSCSDGMLCTVNDLCVDRECVGSTRVCSDSNPCTDDECVEGTGCVFTPNTATCNDNDACTQTSTCQEGECVGADPIVCPPAATCREEGICNPATGICGYAVQQNGTPCSDGNQCTKNDACTSGTCAGTAYTCNDSKTCTDDSCDGDGGCVFQLKPNWCLIGTACIGANQVDYFNSCQICLPDEDPRAWSNNAEGECDDSNGCTFNDHCVDKACEGTSYSCDDGLACTTEFCNGNGGCNRSTLTGWCVIDGVCYQNAQENPENTCLRCTSSVSQTAWTPKSESASCDDGDPCTHTDRCLSGNCQGTTYSCEDELDCTDNTCNGSGGCGLQIKADRCLISGVCRQTDETNPDNECQGCHPLSSQVSWTEVTDGRTCDDGNPCTENDTCIGGTCQAQAIDCNDNLACTLDSCSGGVCSNTLQSGWCLIAGVCRSEGTRDPNNRCLMCQVETSTTDWTPANGATCDDGDVCTTDDQCVGSVCGGTPMDCNDDIECTRDYCEYGECRHAPADGWCRIQGECYLDGATDPANPCQTCDTSRLQTFWSPATGGTCDDGIACSHSDTCVNGACQGTGYACSDGISCTLDQCDGLGGCDFELASGYCLIAGSCVAAGTPSPLNTCLSCDPAVSTNTWSPRNGVLCNDGNTCTFDDTCGDGVCVGTSYTCDDEKECTSNACDGNGECTYQILSGWCVIDDTCKTTGSLDPANQCLACIPSQSVSQWSPLQGAPCSDGDACTMYDSCSSGVCSGLAYSCDDGRDCTDNVCLGEWQCDYVLKSGFCLIDEQCRSPGDKNPANTCQECRPAELAVGWSPLSGMLCDDLDGCTTGDVCQDGACLGTPYDCVDDLDCTANLCDGVGGCTFPLMDDWCYIEDTCYRNGQTMPGDDCVACASAISTSEWTALDPGAQEVCNGIDDDCDGATDPPGSPGCIDYFVDLDGDGYGVSGSSMCLCGPVYPYLTPVDGDCDDDDRFVNPGSDEVCDGKDNNCNGQTDPEGSIGCQPYYQDVDGDSWGVAGTGKCLCEATGDWRGLFEGDCNDLDAESHPGNIEVCDGKDNNCNGLTDIFATDCTVYYEDRDNDGYGVSFPSECMCAPQGVMRATVHGDCNDDDPGSYPGAAEVCDGKDNNCSGGVDDAPLAQMCPTDPGATLHGTVACSSGCRMLCDSASGDQPGWFDNDRNVFNGCECQDDTWSQSGGSICPAPVNLGDLADNGAFFDVQGKVADPDGGDWWKVRAIDLGGANEPTGCDNFNVRVRFINNPNDTFAFDVRRGGCGEENQTCTGAGQVNWATNFRSNGLGECGCTTATVGCTPPADYNACIAVHGVNGNRCGSCPGKGDVNKNLCVDNGADFYIRVYRKADKAPTCSPYRIEISNGLYSFSP